MFKNKKAVTLLELLIAIALVGSIVLAAALAQKMGLDFVESTSDRIKLQNKANLAVEKIVRDGMEAGTFTISGAGNDTIGFDSGSISYKFGTDELSGIEGFFQSSPPNKRFSIHVTEVDGEDMRVDTKVFLRKKMMD